MKAKQNFDRLANIGNAAFSKSANNNKFFYLFSNFVVTMI